MKANPPPTLPPSQDASLPVVPFLQRDKRGGVLVDVHVIPNAARTVLDGQYGQAGQEALRVRLHAPPVDGKANDALLKWLAKQLGLPQSQVSLVRGATSRRKQFHVTADAADLADWTRLVA